MKINQITLFTNNVLKQKQFYKTVLGFQIIEDNPDRISFKTGESILAFEYKHEKVNSSHLAFNIPSNAIYKALEYLKDKTEILPYENEEVIGFESWKAKSVYFYDSDNNIMEFIARERVDINSDIAFTSNSILSISEIAIATDNIKSIYNTINNIKPITIFDGSFERFCALGNDEGLFIVIDKNKKKWYPTMEDAFTSDFIIKGDYNFNFVNGQIKELT
ncbi:VOC family protein [Olleya sp. YS]|uniref:VOC family protein n=1 Tax=Olleya sp. YS TaxID=3028318 RepID=UPI00243415EC|nr:VOC family protein [Olleya sp. YS]WGD35188.1 VOC family protein [Olleya sp. YS]